MREAEEPQVPLAREGGDRSIGRGLKCVRERANGSVRIGRLRRTLTDKAGFSRGG